MFPAYITTILLVVSLLVLLIVVLVLLISYHQMVKRFRYSQRENTFLKNHLHERSVEILDGARTRALGLLEEAEKKAAEIVASAQTYGQTSEKSIQESMASLEEKEVQSLQSATNTRLSIYTTELDKTRQNDINKLHEMTKLLEENVQSELQAVDKALQKEFTDSEVVAHNTLEKAQLAAEQEIAAYKTQRLKLVDERILQLLNTVAADVFGKALSLEEHQQIVIDALETAKKDLVKN